uniref:Uncharacterized protein n=1 Tax=Knipowitschia caucasica TaxID=637954 RepID=A0AAV2KU98_KNICA
MVTSWFDATSPQPQTGPLSRVSSEVWGWPALWLLHLGCMQRAGSSDSIINKHTKPTSRLQLSHSREREKEKTLQTVLRKQLCPKEESNLGCFVPNKQQAALPNRLVFAAAACVGLVTLVQ